MSNSIELKTIKELLSYKFFIPSYQRGYRWKEQQVKDLLDDITNFNKTIKNQFYFLQAIVVAKKNDGKYEVVDGQQRLTTISLLQDNISIDYQSRNTDESCKNREKKTIDEFYKDNAKKVIDKYFENNKDRKDKFNDTLLNNTKVIWYEIDERATGEVFRRMNSGKIPAKDSELIKCVMLTSNNEEPIEITQARSYEWDEIERALNDEYFFNFITPRNCWNKEDKMTIVLRYAGFNNINKDEIFPFLKNILDCNESNSRIEIWKKIYHAYYTLKAYFDDITKYHHFGYLVHRKGNWDFRLELSNIELIEGVEKWNYGENNDDIHKFLFLTNLAYCNRRFIKYNFYEHNRIKTWSLEHVFAQNQKDFNSQEELEKFCNQNVCFAEYEKNKQGYLNTILGDEYPLKTDHGLQNLALLDKDFNSTLNNSLFMRKRELILNAKNWLPPATKAVFLKEYIGMDPTVKFLRDNDKKAYVDAIKQEVETFVSETGEYSK